MANAKANGNSGNSNVDRMKALRETDLSDPIRDYLLAQGYTVRCEVQGCDITAVRGEEFIVVEMKRGLTMDLLVQGTQRQRIADSVYLAVPMHTGLTPRERHGKRWRGMEHLLKRLELGLILVAFPESVDAPPTVEIVFHPIVQPRPRRKNTQRRAVLREIAERSGDYNLGGTPGGRAITAYREKALFMAACLERHGPLTPGRLRGMGANEKAQAILHRDAYGWFERLARGLYSLRPTALVAIQRDYPALITRFREQVAAFALSNNPAPEATTMLEMSEVSEMLGQAEDAV